MCFENAFESIKRTIRFLLSKLKFHGCSNVCIWRANKYKHQIQTNIQQELDNKTASCSLTIILHFAVNLQKYECVTLDVCNIFMMGSFICILFFEDNKTAITTVKKHQTSCLEMHILRFCKWLCTQLSNLRLKQNLKIWRPIPTLINNTFSNQLM